MPGRLTLLVAVLRHATPRPLPDKNELANACYFTYRVGYIICDSGLGPDEAQQDMLAGKCNEDFRLMGSDFQRRVVRHYSAGGPPPLEEAMWLLTAPDNFQSRTLKECPAMQIMAYLLLAEARLHLHGPSRQGAAAELAARALEQAQVVPTEVYTALAKAWPMDMALERFQATAFHLNGLAEARSSEAFRVDFVICRCREDLQWLRELTEPEMVGSEAALFVYEACADQGHESDDLQQMRAFRTLHSQLAHSRGAAVRGECSAQGVLRHILSVTMEAAPAFTVFLSAMPPDGSERGLLEMVVRSLALRTLEVDFLPLGLQRSAPSAPTACDLAIWRDALGLGLPSGYGGARFAVSGARTRERAPGHYHGLLGLLEAPPVACGEGDSGAGAVGALLSSAWHVAFGEEPRLPVRADDERLPLFLRFADGPSGFQGTRMPKVSTYLASVEAEGAPADP